MAQRSITCFQEQDYPRRNLVIVCDGKSQIGCLERYVNGLGLANVKIVGLAARSRTLGALRNISLAEANGDIICQWDDDDIYHPKRLSAQYAYMMRQRSSACFLTDQLQLFVKNQSLYWCDWLRPRNRANWPTVIPNTIMCERRAPVRYPESGNCSTRSEDLFVAESLLRRTVVARYSNVGFLYVYVSHGSNTWSESQHRYFVTTTGLDTAELASRRGRLESELPCLRLPGVVTIRGFNDQAVFHYKPCEGGAECQI